MWDSEKKLVLVDAYAGHRADQRPRRLLWRSRWLLVLEILSTAVIEPVDDPTARKRRFLVRTADGRCFHLEHALLTDRWFVCSVSDDRR